MIDVLVLCYHAVSPRWGATLSVTPDALEAQLATLAARGYRGARFLDAVSAPPHERTVAITFDDSYRSVARLAAPILAEAGYVGTVFVPTAYAGASEPRGWSGTDDWLWTEFAEELTPMSWEELRELRSAGWEVGSHSVTHPHLTQVADADLERELRDSRAAIESEIGFCDTIAYPYGDQDERVRLAARDAGYTAAAGLPGLGSNRLAWPRVGVWHGTDDRRFRLKVSPLLRRAQRIR